MVPTSDIGERDFYSGIRLDKPRDLLQSAAEFSDVLSAVDGVVWTLVDRLDHLYGVKSPFSRHIETSVRRRRIHTLENAGCISIADLKLLEVVHSYTAAAAFEGSG